MLQWNIVQLDESLAFEKEPVAILHRQVWKLRSKKIPSVKVHWRHHLIEEATCEAELNILIRFSRLFEPFGAFLSLNFRGRKSF